MYQGRMYIKNAIESTSFVVFFMHHGVCEAYMPKNNNSRKNAKAQRKEEYIFNIPVRRTELLRVSVFNRY